MKLESGAWSHAWENLKVESDVTYTVKEGQLSGTAFVPYEGSFQLNNKWMRQKSLEYKANADGAEPATGTTESLLGSVSPYGGKATITNDYVSAEINIVKVQSSNHNVKIDGVKFDLLKDANTPSTGDPTYDKNSDSTPVSGGSNLETANGGKLKLPILEPGAYWLLETAVPAGYVMRDAEHPIGIVVSDKGTVRVIDDPAATGNMVLEQPELDESTGAYTLTVPNMRTYALPAAGGLGEMPFLFLGAFLAALAVGGFRTLRRPLAAARAGSRAARGRR